MEQQENPMFVPRMLWAAFLAAIFIYIFIGYQDLMQKGQAISFDSNELSGNLFFGAVIVGLCLIIAANFLLPDILKANNVGQKFILNLLQTAFSEVAAILGIALFFSQHSFTQLIVLCAISLVALLRTYPKNFLS